MKKSFINALVLTYKYCSAFVWLSFCTVSVTSLAQDNKILFVSHAFPWYTSSDLMSQVIAANNAGFDVSMYTITNKKSKELDVFVTQNNLLNKRYVAEIPDNIGSYSLIVCQSMILANTFFRLKNKMGFKARILSNVRSEDLSYKKNFGTDFFKNIDRFICDSQYIHYQLEMRGCDPSKIVVLPTPVDVKKFAFRVKLFDANNAVHFISVGPLNECRPYRDVIRVLKEHILKNDPTLSLTYTIIGNGSGIEDIKRAIADYEMEACIELVGWCGAEELRQRLTDAHIFIHPSCTSNDGMQEGVSDCLKEAMAIGNIVVATRHGGTQELIENGITGVLVAEHDIAHMTHCLRSLLRHPERWPFLQLNARSLIEKRYNVNVFQSSFKQLLTSM